MFEPFTQAMMLVLAGSLGRLLTKRSGEGAEMLGAVIGIFVIMSDDLGFGYTVFNSVHEP